MYKTKYYLPGSIVIAIGILVVAIPEILIAIVASAIIMIGIALLYIGHMMRNSDSRVGYFNRRVYVDDGDGEGFFNMPRMKWRFRRF